MDEMDSPTGDDQPDDVSMLLGLNEPDSDYDPNLTQMVKTIQESKDQVLRAILALQDRRFRALWSKFSALDARIGSGERVSSMTNFMYAWIKGAEQSGVYKLPPR